MSAPPKDLFKRHTTRPVPLHAAVQGQAREVGRTPPLDNKEQQKEQPSQQKEAGKLSARVRKERADLRQRTVEVVYDQLKPAYRSQPYSTETFRVVKDAYLRVIRQEPDNVLDKAVLKLAAQAGRDARDEYRFRFCLSLLLEIPKLSEADREILGRVSEDTLIKDFKQLGIRSRRKQKRSG
jgi:hypothetical protein